jgi:hypothetical protein
VIGDPEIVAFHMKERAWVGDREEPLFPRGTNDLSLVRTGSRSAWFWMWRPLRAPADGRFRLRFGSTKSSCTRVRCRTVPDRTVYG